MLAKKSNWSNLKKVSLSNDMLGPEGGAVLGKKTTWIDLEILMLNSNRPDSKTYSP